jgi:hypothetical protein
MDKDLLPWILGGALVTTGAIAAAAADAPDPTKKSGPPAMSASAGVADSTKAPVVAIAPRDAAILAPKTDEAPLPAGEVWQCIVNGQKVFSDRRCGSGASVRQIGDLNVMDVPAAAPAAYAGFRPASGPTLYPSSSAYPDDQEDARLGSDYYPGQAFIVARERARREHMTRPEHQARAAPNRGVSGPRNPR